MAKSSGFKLIANNKKRISTSLSTISSVRHCALVGTEVKSMRMGKCGIKELLRADLKRRGHDRGMHISPYEKGNIFQQGPLRERKLLMHHHEINKLKGKIQEKVIP